MPYDEMPDIYARASCMVLASIPRGPRPRGLAAELLGGAFGMVLAEAMAAGVPILAAASGAIPEVTHNAVPLFPPGDWQELARLAAVR